MPVIKNIPFEFDLDQMLKKLGLTGRKRLSDEFVKMAEHALEIARPKGLFLELEIEEKGDRYIVLDKVKLESRVLSVNLEGNRIAFPSLATCGVELDNWASTMENILHQFWAKTIVDTALSFAITALETELKKISGSETISIMTPGSIGEWPISEQKQLFHLFGNQAEEIGVHLTDSFLMRPVSTLSCIAFASETRFFSCMLCPRTDCASRRANYDVELLAKKYHLSNDLDSDMIPLCQS